MPASRGKLDQHFICILTYRIHGRAPFTFPHAGGGDEKNGKGGDQEKKGAKGADKGKDAGTKGAGKGKDADPGHGSKTGGKGQGYSGAWRRSWDQRDYPSNQQWTKK